MGNFDETEVRRPIELNASDLDERQIEALIKAFISPDDTDLGLSKEQYAAKERIARKQIATGSLRVIFDESSDTTMLMSSQDWRNLSAKF